MKIVSGRRLPRALVVSASAIALGAFGPAILEGTFGVPQAAAQGAAASLPKPYVSRAVDATLMELTPAVRSQFGIKPNVRGVLVLSTDPTGIAAKNNILPGDVITDIRGRPVAKPIDVDTHVLYYLKKGDTAFQFTGNRGGNPWNTAAQITLALFDAVIDLATIGSWGYYDYGGFSYTEYYTQYSSVIVEEYSYSETVITETVESSSFESTMTSEVTEESSIEETSSEETSVEESSEEEETAEAAEESDADEADDADDAGDDDGGDDDGGDDDGGDDGGDE
ncbi:PDZ domain-containing protein [Erythrobacter sp. WG]|uniref:PDZ domain-containing protein n=1 Tax=Erythrobacter sp. WG TaxID=2985510 RepID=UPI00226ECD54|nr:PDZ domain-containing protein [Erythrobacter sp. WG]MCX9146990.1 PDZ domain-containing protein [Erythrobacter sp. WG]